jgi:hypothetical protein
MRTKADVRLSRIYLFTPWFPIMDLHVKSNLLNRINVIWAVQSLLQKYSDFQKHKSAIYPFPSRPTQQGRSRSSRTQGAGCDGRGWCFRRERQSRTAKSCGPDTLTPVSSWRRQTAGDGGKRARLTGESTKETVKPLRAGMPDVSGGPVVTNSCVSRILHARLRVHWAPGIPHALWGGNDIQNSGDSRRENVDAYLSTSLRAQRSNPAFFLLPQESWIASSQELLAMTFSGCLKIESTTATESAVRPGRP